MEETSFGQSAERRTFQRFEEVRQQQSAFAALEPDLMASFCSIAIRASYNLGMSRAALATIELRPNHSRQPRAYIAGTRNCASRAFMHLRSCKRRRRMRLWLHSHLTLHQVHSALAYYFQHRDEILQEMREDDDFASAREGQARSWTARQTS